MDAVLISPSFRSNTIKALLAILLFIIVYLIAILVAVWLFIYSWRGAAFIALNGRGFLVYLAAAGLAIAGLMCLIYSVKFIFQSSNIDRSGQTEIYDHHAPELYKLIEDLSKEIGTEFPNRIYIDHQVNAAVQSNPNFLSLFIPEKKDLLIGIGLVNALTVEELRAILAHEFGHFSQKSLKVGSYVYQVNQVIYKQIYENEGIDSFTKTVSELHAVIGLVVLAGQLYIKGVKKLLAALYKVINKRYMALSREMEFHADEVSVRVSGTQAANNAMLRIQLADTAMNEVMQYIDKKVSQRQKSNNIFTMQRITLQVIAENDQLPVVNDLPLPDQDYLKRHNKSKIVTQDQWASHPSTADRLARINALGIQQNTTDQRPASVLFEDYDKICVELTRDLYSKVENHQQFDEINVSEFKTEYSALITKSKHDPLFNGYFDNWNISIFELAEIIQANAGIEPVRNLFTSEDTGRIHDLITTSTDQQHLLAIDSKQIDVNRFEYDGIAYKRNDAKNLAATLERQAEKIKQDIKAQDLKILSSFRTLALSGNSESKFDETYTGYKNADSIYDEYIVLIQEMQEHFAWFHETNSTDLISKKMNSFLPFEEKYKKVFLSFVQQPQISNLLETEEQLIVTAYEGSANTYFFSGRYHDAQISQLGEVQSIFYKAINQHLYTEKMKLYQLFATLAEAA